MVAPEAACRNLQRLAAEGLLGPVRPLRSDRLHAFAPAARASERRRALVHGAPPGHEPAGSGLPAAGPADAAALRVRSAVPGDHAAAAGARAQGRGVVPARGSNSPRCAATAGRRGNAVRVFSSPDTPMPEVQLLSNGRYHVMVTQRRRRLQPLEGPRRHPLARRHHPRQLGHVLLPPRRGERGVLVDRPSADAAAGRRATRRSSPRPGPSSAAAILGTGDAIDTHTEIVVSPEDDIELRRVRITNRVAQRRDDRADQLRRSGARPAGRRRAASGVQQSVRADRDHARAAGDRVHAPAALARRAGRPGCST